MDYSLFKALNGMSGRVQVLDATVAFLAIELSVLFVVLVALLFLLPWGCARRDRRRAAVSATAAAAFGLFVNQPIAAAVGRFRPYVTHPYTHLLIARSQDPSFPSDHATGAFAMAMSVWLYDRRFGAVLFVLAAVLAVSRVYVGTHYPSDVAGGALIGLAVALMLHIGLAKRALEGLSDRLSALWDQMAGFASSVGR